MKLWSTRLDLYRLSTEILPNILELILHLIFIVNCYINVLKFDEFQESTICYTVLNKRRIKTQKRMTKNQQDLYKNDIWYSNVTEFWSSNVTTR